MIPTQFVLFNFTAIVGSAVLYRDFDSIPLERMVIFLYGCASTFLGVFVLARPSSSDSRANSPLLRPTIDGRDANDSSPSRRNTSLAYSFPSPSCTAPPRLPTPGTTPLRPNVPLSPPPSRPSRIHPLRSRASSSGLGLSPATQYLLFGIGSTPPNVPTSLNNGSTFAVSPVRGQVTSQSQPQPQPSISRSQSNRETEGRINDNGRTR